MIDRINYIIERQRFEVAYHDGRKGLGLPNELSALFRERIAPLLEMILEEEDKPGYYIRLDRIVVDAGSLPPGQWERLLTERVARQFREELRRQLQARALHGDSAAALSAAGDGGDATGDREDLEQGEQGWEDGPRAAFRGFLRFLSTGTLAGWIGTQSLPVLERQVASVLLLPCPPTWKLRLARQLAEEPVCLERFLLQLDPSFQDRILEWLGYRDQRISISVSGRSRLDPVIQNRLETLLRLWQGLSLQGPAFLYQLEAPGVVLEKIIAGLSDPPLEEELRKLLPKGTVILRDPEEQRRSLAGSAPPEEEGIFIGNAGLVLLHPFLSAYMRQVGLLDDRGGWRNPAAQERGLWLSQYLVTGQTELEEPAVALNKLLCGYPMDQPAARHWEPSPEEVLETEQLLEQVIGHWPALKNTGVGGLRANFLLREGKLQRQDDGWLLQVGQKSWDVLLGYLPWGIAYIKNQWMKERLVTEWA